MLKPQRARRKRRTKAKVMGTAKRPRLSIYRSNRYIYAQLVDDENNNTLAAASGLKAKDVGLSISKSALKNKIKEIVFDRAGYKYHGKVKVVADSAREGGLKF